MNTMRRTWSWCSRHSKALSWQRVLAVSASPADRGNGTPCGRSSLRPRAIAGVTLIELLIAISITLILSGILLGVTQTSLNVWQRAQDGVTADAEAKLALDLMARDLQSALFRSTGGTWLAADIISGAGSLTTHGWQTSGTIKPSGSDSLNLLPSDEEGVPATIASARFGLSGVWLRFVTTNVEAKGATNPGGSQPIVVSYQIARRPLSGAVSATNPAAVRYTLYRSAVAADTSVVNGLSVLANAYGSTTSGYPAARSARSVTNPSSGDAAASNVVDFGVWFYRRTPAGELQRIFPSSASDVAHTASSAADFPAAADVMIRMLTSEGAAMVEALENGGGGLVQPVGLTASQWWWSIVEAHSRVFVRRVEIAGGGP